MAIKRLTLNPKEMITGFHLSQVQDNFDLSISQIQNSEFQNGVIMQVALISGQDNVINHGLDRKVQGWTVIGKNAQSDIWESSSSNPFPTKRILLRSSSNVTIKLYLF